MDGCPSCSGTLTPCFSCYATLEKERDELKAKLDGHLECLRLAEGGWDEPCPQAPGFRVDHCSCVPILRAEILRLRAEVKRLNERQL